MKKMYKKKSFLNLKAMLVMALVCFMTVQGFSADWTGKLRNGITYTVTTTTGNKFRVSCPGDSNFDGNEYDGIGDNLYCQHYDEATIVFNNTSPILINHSIRVYDACKLHLVKGVLSDQPTLKRGSRGGEIIYIAMSSSYNGDPTLYINGYGNDPSNMSSRFILDGGAVFSTPYDARTTATSQGSRGRMIYFYNGGNIQVENAIFQNAYNTGEAGFIEYNYSDHPFTLSNFNHVLFRGSHAKAGAVILWRAASRHDVTMQDVEIWGCDNR